MSDNKTATYPEVRLRPGKDASLQRFHPWVFSGAIARLPKDLEEGDLVRVVTADGKVAAGLSAIWPADIPDRPFVFPICLSII